MVTQTLDNLKLPLTWSNFCFPSDHFCINLPSITQTMFWAPDKSKKKKCTAVWITEFSLTATYSLSLRFGQSSLNKVSSTAYLSSFEVCMLLEFIPHPISLFSVICFELSITWTIFDFPWRFELLGGDCKFFGIQDLAYFKVFIWDQKGYELTFGQLLMGEGSKSKTPIKFQFLFMITKDS